VNIPEDLKYTKADEWVRLEADIATIGITDYAQDHLSDIVFAEIVVSAGDSLEQGKVIATVESVKASSDITAPISGKVIEINEQINQTPELLNSDPYGQAWLIKVRIDPSSKLSDLIDGISYRIYREE
jgi:glycine cleavage system H protein